MSSLDHLKSQRRDIAGRLGVAMEAQSKLREATNAESAALEAIGALGAAEIESVKRWAEAGGRDAMPAPDIAERRRLAEALVSAQARGAAAQGALAGLDVAQRDLSGELRSTNAAIDDAAYDALEARHADEARNIAAMVAEHITPRLARCMALHAMLVQRGQEAISAGRTDAGTALLRRAEKIGRQLPPLDAEPGQGDVVGKIQVWASRFADLVKDDLGASNVIAIGGAAA